VAARGSAKGQQYALGDVTRDGSIAPTNEPARAGGEHASRSAHFDEVDARSSVTVEASDPEHGRSSNLQLEKGTPDDLRSLPAARQRAAGAHDRRHDRARLQRATRSGYVRHVRAFAAFIGRSPDTATAEDLRLFQLHQTQIGMQPPSINSAVSALRFFFTVTLDRPDLARRLTVVPHPRRIPAVLSVEEVTLLLRAASAPKYKAAFATAGACPRAGRRPDPWGAGLRVSEVVALKVGDVDSDRMLLRVERGKGRKDRHAMLSPQLLRLLRTWWREGRRCSLLLPGGWLFPGRNPVEPLSARQLCRAVRAAAQAAGIKKRVSPHTLRHSFATHLLGQDVDIRVIQTLLGHAKLDTTALYTRVANTTIRAVTSPLDRLASLIDGRSRPEA